MSMAEIEAELERLSPEELRQLALKSWSVFLAKDSAIGVGSECDEDDPQLLAWLDEAVAGADANLVPSHSGNDLRARMEGWTTK